MGFTKNVTGGVDLTRPRATPGWMVGAAIGIAILIGVGMVAYWAVNQVKARATGILPTGSASNSSSLFGEVL